MNRNTSQADVPQQTIEPQVEIRAAVSFELTAEEINNLIDLCADNGQFRLGIRIAERKSRLLANIARMRKDLAKAGAAAA